MSWKAKFGADFFPPIFCPNQFFFFFQLFFFRMCFSLFSVFIWVCPNSHEKMSQSLHRMSIPVEILDAIKAIYQKPMFQVMHRDKFSSWLSQRTGIRQGCPLSPYLFIVTMHVLFHDVHRKFNDPRYAKTFQGINFHELLYADDTLILTKSFASANQYLHLIEEESQYLDLNLNKSKCC